MKKCSKCGNITDNGTYCPQCGGLLSDSNPGEKTSMLKSSMGKGATKFDSGPNSCLKEKRSDTIISDASEDRETKPIKRADGGELIQYSRSPRLIHNIEHEEIEILPPPIIGGKPEISWVSTLLPVIATLSVAVLVTVLMSNTMMLIYTLPMTVVGLIVSIVNYRNQVTKFNATVSARQENYISYIAETETYIQEKQKQQLFSLNTTNPATAECFDIVDNMNPNLWERRPTDEDFLSVRVGHGKVSSCVQLLIPRDELSLEKDDLRDLPKELYRQYNLIDNAPINVDILRSGVSGIVGLKTSRLQLIKNVIVQLTTHYCYTDLRMVCIYNKSDEIELRWVRELPHFMDEDRKKVFVASSIGDAEILLKDFSDILEQRAQSLSLRKPENGQVTTPYYLFLILEPSFVDEGAAINKYILRSPGLSVGTIIAADEISDLPKECNEIIEVESGKGRVFCKDRAAISTGFLIDDVSGKSFTIFAKTIRKMICEEEVKLFTLPKSVTFLEMYGVEKAAELEPLKRWKKNDPISSLAVPIGIGADGEPFYLDLHEKSHGPHGLVAGTTGSGKSEFLLSYILSLAVNFHPDEVAFVLIDYKGGGLAGAFDDPERGLHLPHLLATITNLDGSTIQRSLVSIESELARRQRIFNDAKSLSEESTLDIYKYQKLYREKRVNKPLPHLFIISDEFAELKQQQPEFMDKLISIARIGRSLGVHLILSTQKPGGVVNDQILSNTKFKVCLKVQDRNDSMEVLGRSEAAEIKETGRFYLQVGYDEWFAMGQSAWSGAPYKDEVIEEKLKKSRFRGSLGRAEEKESSSSLKKPVLGTELLNIVKLLSDTANNEGIPKRSLWEPELQTCIPIESLNTGTCANNVVIGMMDDPENQKQFPLVIDLAQSNHILIVGGSGSGKTQLCQALILHMAEKLSPVQFNFYVLDFSSHLMRLMKGMPHCGAVLTEDDAPKIKSFFEIINSIVSERKKLFLELEVDNYESACAVREIPLILVVIDNLSGLNATKEGSEFVYKLPDYLKNSAKYGVIYLITSSYLNDVSTRIRQGAGTLIALSLKDKYDYAEFLHCPVEYLPPKIPGRALYNWNGRPLEMQLVSFEAELESKARVQMMKEKILNLTEMYSGGRTARRLPVYSETATYEEFADQFKLGRIPIGYLKTDSRSVALPLKQFSMLSIYYGNPKCSLPITENILYAIKREAAKLWIVKAKDGSLFDGECKKGINPDLYKDAVLLEADNGSVTSLWRALSAELKDRKEVFDKYCQEKGIDPNRDDVHKLAFRHLYETTKPVFVLFESLADFCLANDSVGVMVYNQLFQIAKKRNFYFIGIINPDDNETLAENSLFRRFNPDDNIIMFGGQTNKQTLFTLPAEVSSKEIRPFNECMMIYQNGYYPLLMPCGEIEKEQPDDDDENIFGVG